MAARGGALTPRFRWDERTRRYHDRKTGRFVPRTAIVGALDRIVSVQAYTMGVLTDQLNAGDLSIPEWQREMAAEIKRLHLAAAASARGGWAQMTAGDWGWLGARLKAQYRYLERFARDLESGKTPLGGRAAMRARLYANAARATHVEMTRRMATLAGARWERRILGPAEHCPDCLAYAARGWSPIGTLPPIGDSQCRTNCRCVFEYDAGENRPAASAPSTQTPPGVVPPAAPAPVVASNTVPSPEPAPPIAPQAAGPSQRIDAFRDRAVEAFVNRGANVTSAARIVEAARELRAETGRKGVEVAELIDLETGDSVGGRAYGSVDAVTEAQMSHQLRAMVPGRRYTHLHTHPSGASFSGDDVDYLLSQPEFDSIVVAGVPGGRLMVLRKSAVHTQAVSEQLRQTVKARWHQLEKELRPPFQARFNAGEDSGTLWREHSHGLLTRLAAEYGLDYELIEGGAM